MKQINIIGVIMRLKNCIGCICCLLILGSCATSSSYKFDKFFSKIDNFYGITLEACDAINENDKENKDFFNLSISNLPEDEFFELHVLNVKGEIVSPGVCYKDGLKNIIVENSKSKSYLNKLLIPRFGLLKGEPLIFVLLTKDKVPCARLEYVPYPNEAIAKDGARISVVLMSATGEFFRCRGTGFKPFEKLTTYSESCGEKIVLDLEAGEKGDIDVFLNPVNEGHKGGKATFMCLRENNEQLITEYFWGSKFLEEGKKEKERRKEK